MIVRTLKENVDERFLIHRLRATSLAGVVGGVTASAGTDSNAFAIGIRHRF